MISSCVSKQLVLHVMTDAVLVPDRKDPRRVMTLLRACALCVACPGCTLYCIFSEEHHEELKVQFHDTEKQMYVVVFFDWFQSDFRIIPRL